jgi:hypothetical protein
MQRSDERKILIVADEIPSLILYDENNNPASPKKSRSGLQHLTAD